MVATVLGDDELISEQLAQKSLRHLKSPNTCSFRDERREQEILLRNPETAWWRLFARSGQHEAPLQPEPCKSHCNRANRLENRCSSDIEVSNEAPFFSVCDPSWS